MKKAIGMNSEQMLIVAQYQPLELIGFITQQIN